MGADEDAVERTVVLAVAVISTLLNGAFDALVCLAVHRFSSFDLGCKHSMPRQRASMQEIASNVAFPIEIW